MNENNSENKENIKDPIQVWFIKDMINECLENVFLKNVFYLEKKILN